VEYGSTWLASTPVSSASLAQVRSAAARPGSPVPALLGQDHRGGAKGVQGEHAGYRGAFNTAHDHNILAPRALDASRGDTEFKTGNRVQRWQRTKTNSHECAPL
jgi:hypothetical protein